MQQHSVMAGDAWLGGIYLKDEGGYYIVMRALQYYLRVLKKLSGGAGSELSATLSHIIQQEAGRVGPLVLQAGKDLKEGMANGTRLAAVQNNIQYVLKALESYRAGVIAGMSGKSPQANIDAAFLSDEEVARIDEALARVSETAPHQES